MALAIGSASADGAAEAAVPGLAERSGLRLTREVVRPLVSATRLAGGEFDSAETAFSGAAAAGSAAFSPPPPATTEAHDIKIVRLAAMPTWADAEGRVEPYSM